MFKRFVALGIMCVLLTGLFVGIAVPVSAVEPVYKVGYARVDVNPYVEDGNFDSGIMALPLRGTGDPWNRLSTQGLVDDNGDGVIDENDGLKATCIAVTDSNGVTVLFITIDLIGGTLYNMMYEAILSRVKAEIADGKLEDNIVLTKEQIFYAGTHTHNAPEATVYSAAGKTGYNDDGIDLSVVNENLGIWIERTIEDVADAAIQALHDRAAATVTKDQINVDDATSEAVAGKVLNSNRHYTTVDHNGDKVVIGDGFNNLPTTEYTTTRGDDPQQVTAIDETMYFLRFDFADTSKLPIIFANWRAHPSLNNNDSYPNSGSRCLSSDFVNTFRHALEYGCEVTIDKDHAAGYVKTWEFGVEQKYRVAYFQGNGGNANPRGFELQKDADGKVITEGDTIVTAATWIELSGTNAEYNGEKKGLACAYGVVLARFAQEGIEDEKNEQLVKAGDIRTMQKSFTADRKVSGVTQLSYNASVAYQEAAKLKAAADETYTPAKTAYDAYVKAHEAYLENKSNQFFSWYYENKRKEAEETYLSAMADYKVSFDAYVTFMQANTMNTPVTEVEDKYGLESPDKTVLNMPFIFKNADGETFAIASKWHASSVIGDWNANLNIPKTTGTAVNLYTILMGSDLAFVVVPGEPFDYYYKEEGVYTPENNLWNILENETYGKPIVLGYTNGALGYFPNSEAYVYNEGSENYAIGSYEAHNNNFAQGTGETMVRYFDMMLDMMEAESYDATCSHCQDKVTWQPFQGSSPLSDGHYYLPCDYRGAQIPIQADAKVCFDLNGHTITGETRAFYVNKNAEFTLMDTSDGETGVAQGCGGGVADGFGGATLNVQAGSVFNFYSGNLKFYQNGDKGVVSGGTVTNHGTVNMYGGTIHGGKVSSFTGNYIKNGAVATTTKTGFGGTVYISKGNFNIYGGKITAGVNVMVTGTVIGDETRGYAYSQTEETINGTAPCIALNKAGKIKLAGAAQVDDIYFYDGINNNLTVEGAFTGTAELSYYNCKNASGAIDFGTAVADSDGVQPDIPLGKIAVKDCPDGVVVINNGNVVLYNNLSSYCEGCKKKVNWTIAYDGYFTGKGKTLAAGHYYLVEDSLSAPQLQLNVSTTNVENQYCFDLAGCTLKGASRAFYLYKGATLNLMDSCGGGAIAGKTSTRNGGTVFTDPGSEFNLYGGTIQGVANVTNGGGIHADGDVNIYGGTVQGSDVTGYGCAIYMRRQEGNEVPHLNIYGGTITAGKAAKAGQCVYANVTKDDIASHILIAGDATVDEIRFGATVWKTYFTVDATEERFTGSVQLSFTTLPKENATVGNYKGTNGIGDGITIIDSVRKIAVDGSVLKAVGTTVDIYEDTNVICQCASLDAAIEAFTYEENAKRYVRLSGDSAEALTISKDVYLDLNGFDLSGNITVESGTLYCMDSATDDYTVNDTQGYGLLTGTVTGDVRAVVVNTIGAIESEKDAHRAGYLKVTETDPQKACGISFHRVNLRIYGLSLRPANVGLYYKSNFIGDEIVADKVESYGLALSTVQEPTAENIDTYCLYTAHNVFNCGQTGNADAATGVILANIMKPGIDTNEARAEIDIYGCAYIKTEDGYLFGKVVVRDLKQVVEAIDAKIAALSSTQKAGLLEMYNTYSDVMSKWNVPELIKAAAGE